MLIFILRISKSFGLVSVIVSIWKVNFNNDVVNGSLDSIRLNIHRCLVNRRRQREDVEVNNFFILRIEIVWLWFFHFDLNTYVVRAVWALSAMHIAHVVHQIEYV